MPTHIPMAIAPDSRRRHILAAMAAVAIGAIAVGVLLWSSSARRRTQPEPVPVSGTITLDGHPLPDGDVAFDGLDGSPPVHAAVMDGRFTLATRPGEKRIIVNRFQNTTEKNYLGDPVQVSMIPERYNLATELRTRVNADGPNHVSLELRSK